MVYTPRPAPRPARRASTATSAGSASSTRRRATTTRPVARGSTRGRRRAGSAAPSRYPLYTGFSNCFGTSVSEASMRPRPMLGGAGALDLRACRPATGRGGARVRPHCRSRSRGTESLRKYGAKRMGGGQSVVRPHPRWSSRCSRRRRCRRPAGACLATALKSVSDPPSLFCMENHE